MKKNILLFNSVIIMFLFFCCNTAYSELNINLEPNGDLEKNENIEGEPYKRLEDLKKELRDERKKIDQQRLEEIKKKEEEKKEKQKENNINNEEINKAKEKVAKEKQKENELIPTLIVRLRGKHSTKYLCSYNFIIKDEVGESELVRNIIDDYTVLLKKPSLKVRANEVINFEFSETPKKVRAYIWQDEIEELEMKKGTIRVPDLEEKIVVCVEGTYKNGQILYAIVLDIRR